MSNFTHPNVVADLEAAPISGGTVPSHQVPIEDADYNEKKAFTEGTAVVTAVHDQDYVTPDGEHPTEWELATLKKVPAGMPWPAIAMCLIEFAERASYYGSTGPFSNFVNNPLPVGGSGTGAVAKGSAGLNEKAGALDKGSQVASAITTSFSFLAYTIPILGGIIADTKWGRFKTICVGTAIGFVAHVLLVIPAIPSVIAHPSGAFGAFVIAVYFLAFAAGFIKPSLAPLLCDQAPIREPTVMTNKKGERVIVDPQATVQRYLLIFYWCINIGAFFALATSYAERDVGFWLAFLLPGILYMMMPIVLFLCWKKLYKAPPQGSVLVEAFKVFKCAMSQSGGFSAIFKGKFWDNAKPSVIAAKEGSIDTNVVFWDDRFVDEIKQSLAACSIFFLIPIFSLSDGGIGNSENDMSDAMVTGNTPNDLISNFNSLTIVFFTPLLTYVIYPQMAKLGYPLKPMTRMSIGFFLGGINMVFGAIIQWKVYQTSPCGYYATTCADVSDVSLWWSVPLAAVPAVGELFVNVTSYEIAYMRAPARMKGLVYALNLFNSAIASAISLACTAAITDPYLIWPYVAIAVACFICCFLFPTVFKQFNEPVELSSIDRMEGKEQPRALMAAPEEKV